MAKMRVPWDWSAGLAANFTTYLSKLFPVTKPWSYLEIGTFRGSSAVWMLENVLKHKSSKAYCVDTFANYGDWNGAKNEGYARAALAKFVSKVEIHKGRSKDVLKKWQHQHDIIYVDGDHTYAGCLLDSLLAWPLLREGGVMIWDDYRESKSMKVPGAVATFLPTVKAVRMFERHKQLGVRKLSEVAVAAQKPPVMPQQAKSNVSSPVFDTQAKATEILARHYGKRWRDDQSRLALWAAIKVALDEAVYSEWMRFN